MKSSRRVKHSNRRKEKLRTKSARDLLEDFIQLGRDNPHPIDMKGGSFSEDELCNCLGVPLTVVESMREDGRLVHYSHCDGVRYPTFQIENGKVLDGIGEVLATMTSNRVNDPRAQAMRFMSTMTARDGKPARIIELLRNRQIEEAKDLVVVQAQR